MAQPTVFPFGKGLFYLGDAATPTEVFNKLCGFNSFSISLDANTSETVVADCDDPDAPAWVARDKVSQSASFSCSGVLAKASLPLIVAAFQAGAARNCRFQIVGGGTGSGTPDYRFSGAFHVKFSIKSERGNKMEVEFSGESDGVVAMANVAAIT